jgi:hypothetical protein
MKKLITITLIILCCYLITTQKTNAQQTKNQKQQTKNNTPQKTKPQQQIQPKNKFTPIHNKPYPPKKAHTDKLNKLPIITSPSKLKTASGLNYSNNELKEENETIKQYEKRTLIYEKRTFEYHLDMITFIDTDQAKKYQNQKITNDNDWIKKPQKPYTTRDFIQKFTKTPELNNLRPEFTNPNLPKIKIDEIKKIPIDATKEEIETYKALLTNEFENMHKKQKTLENHNKKLNEFIENIEEYMHDYDRFHKGKPIK